MMIAIFVIVIQLLLISALVFIIIPVLYGVATSTSNGQAPFVPTRKSILPDIVRALELKENSILYDLGCGDGRILQSAIKLTPQAKGIGIDHDWFPIMLAKW